MGRIGETMSHLIEIQGGAVVSNDAPADDYLPVGTHMDRPDGYYVAFGMDVEGPYGRAEALDRIDHLKRATRRDLEAEDHRKQRP